MARLPLVDPDAAAPDAADLLRRIAGERGKTFNVYRMLANSPGTLHHVFTLTSYLWNDSALAPRLQELVILRVALLTRSEYEWARHRVLARRVGVPDEQVEALVRWDSEPERFDDVERAVLTLTDAVIRDIDAGPEIVATVRGLLGDQATLELVVLIGLYRMVSGMLRSLAVD